MDVAPHSGPGNRMEPHSPPYFSAELPVVGGRIGPDPEDFVVDELPAYEPSGSGEHVYVRLRKRGWTTPDAIAALARAAGVDERDVGSAGMKDKHAVTTQWLSLPSRASDPATWQLPDGLSVAAASRHANKLRTGHLLGNRFRLRLTGVSEGGLARAQAIMALIEQRGLPNYYGRQRFGRGGGNLDQALDWLRRGAPSMGKRTRFARKLWPSVVQAEIFNRYLSARLRRGVAQLLEGEVVRLDGAGASFVVRDLVVEQPRYEAGDLHLTGPMPGPRMKAAEGDALALEAGVAGELGIDAELLATLGRLVDGTRRDLFLHPAGLRAERAAEDALVVEFTLPSGGYATGLLRELTRDAEDGVSSGS